MKILVVCQFYYPENFVISKIAEKLVEYSHDVTVLTGKPNYGYGHILPEYKKISHQNINGVKVERVKLIPRKKSRFSIIQNYLSFWMNSKRWVRKTKEKFDIVYSMSLSPVTILSAGNLYKKKHNVKHIVHCVDLWPESVLVTHAVKKNSLIYKMLYKWSKSLYSKVDEVLLGSPSYEEYFKNVLKLNDIEYKYVPQPSLVEKSDASPYKYDSDFFNILYCGNLGTIQLTEYLPEAMNRLKDYKIRCHVIGMGPMTNNLLKKINEYKLENLFYYGPMPAYKAASYFKGADAIYVSLKDSGYVGKTIPNKLAMSMTFEKPIIAMLGGDGRKVLETSNGGIFVDESIDSLCEAIINMSKKTIEERKRLGLNNLTYYKDNFSLDKISKIIEKELFNKVL